MDKFDRIVYALTDLRLPKDPNKPDIVELESRILYSASPFMMWGGEPVAEPLSEFECPPHLTQEYWDSFLLELASSSTSESLLKITDAIKVARGLDVEHSVDSSNSFDADSADVDDVNETCDGMDDVDTLIETPVETKFNQIEQLLAGLVDPEDTRVVLHGTDGTDRLGTEWLFYGNGQNANVDLQHWGMKFDGNGSPLIYGCDISTRERDDTLMEVITAAMAKHAEIAGSISKQKDLFSAPCWSLESHVDEIEKLSALSIHLHSGYEGLYSNYTLANYHDNAADVEQQAVGDTCDTHRFDSIEFPLVSPLQTGMLTTEPRDIFETDDLTSNPNLLVLVDVPVGPNGSGGGEVFHATDFGKDVRRELAFVDTQISGYERLVDDLSAKQDSLRQIDVVLLAPAQDGIVQISHVLAGYHDLDAVHLVTHGMPGALKLGNTWLTKDTLTAFAPEISNWGTALAFDGDFLLYGCELASTSEGRQIVDLLARLTSADVAANLNNSGSTVFGGDWSMEYRQGSVETDVVFSDALQQHWQGLMAVSVDAVSTGTTTDTSVTISHTTSSNSNLAMLVGISTSETGTVASVTYSGVALNFVGVSEAANGAHVEIWSLLNPPAGTNDVVVNLNSVGGAEVGVMTFTGVNPSAPFGNFVSASGIATVGSVAAPSNTGDMVFGVVSVKQSNQELVPSGSQSEQWDLFAGTESNGGGSTVEGASSLSMSWTWGANADWAIGGVTLQQWMNSTPTEISIVPQLVRENSSTAGNLLFGTLGAIDPDGIDGFSYELLPGVGDTDNERFVISGNQLQLKAGQQIDFETSPFYSVRVKVTDSASNSFDKNLTLSVTDVSEVETLSINGLETQRSMVSGLTIAFDTDVSIQSDALVVRKRGVSGGLVGVSFTTQVVAGKTVATLAFHGGFALNGSLKDGNYDLQIIGSKVSSAKGLLDGNKDGVLGDNFLFGKQVTDKFYRFFGDSDGDRDVDAQDYGKFGLTYRKTSSSTAFNSAFDFDRDGDVDAQDYGQFGLRYRKVLGFDPFAISNNPPVVSSNGGNATASIFMSESLTTVTTVTSTDVDGGTPFYSLGSGGDSAKFTIDSSTGVLRFIASPDFENPADLGFDNVYDVIVQVSDGYDTNQQEIAIRIIDAAYTLIVTTSSDVWDGDVSSIEALNTNRGVDGEISLREAILAANNTAGVDTIRFDIAGRGIRTIYLTAALPTITDAIVLDATTQAGYLGSPILELDGRSAGLGADCLTLGSGSSGSTIRGFVINRFSGDGIQIDSDNNTIAGNMIGLRPETGLADQTIERTDLHTWLRTDGGAIVDSVDGHAFTNVGVTLTSGRVGQGMTFDGLSGLTAANPNEFNLNQFTYGFWFNRSGSVGYENLIGRAFDDGQGWTVHLDPSGSLKLRVDTGAYADQQLFSSVSGLADGAWHFGAVSMDMATRHMSIAVDGGAVSSGNYTGNFSAPSGGVFAIGRGVVGADNYRGQLDEVQIFDRVLASNEINSLYNTYSGTANVLGNAGAGVLVNTGAGNMIGGTTTADRNVIGNNSGAGVSIASGAGGNTQVVGNFIGTDVSGVLNFGNSGSGIAISAGSGHRIGGTTSGTANRIAFNGADGVSIETGAGSGSIVLGNTIYGNGDLGIDLGNDGVTANDTGDGDAGANDLQNFPVLAMANSVGGNTTLAGTLNSQANTSYRIEFYSNPSGTQDPTNHGEGRVVLGWTEVTTDGSGNAAISTILNGVTVAVGDRVTATATRKIGANSYGSTSEFGLNVTGISNRPTDLSTTGFTVYENAANNTRVGTITCSDIDVGDTPRYSLVDSAGGRFVINSGTGVLTVADSSRLNYETDFSHSITIRVTDIAGASYDEVFLVTLTDVDEFDVSRIADTNAAANSVSENSTVGTVVGISVSASDFDATNNRIIYSMADSDGGRFAVDPNTGIVTVAGRIDRETDGPTQIITIRATSADGSFSEESFQIGVYDVDEFDITSISDVSSGENAVTENAVAGTMVSFQAFSYDADATLNRVVYTLDDNAGGRFSIDGNTGVVTVADGSGLNYEANASHSIIVRASSDDGTWSVMTVGISVLNIEESPIGFSAHYSTSYIDVLRVHGAGLLNSVFDPDGDMLTFRILSGPSSGELAFTSDGKFDYTPHAGFIGQVTFAYVAFDGVLESEPIFVAIDVVLPANVASSGPGLGGPSGNGSGNSTPTVARGETSKGTDVPLSISVVETDGFQGSKTIRSTGGGEVGRLDLRDGRRVGDFRAALSERVTGIEFDQWATKHSYQDLENYRRREETVPLDLIWANGSHELLDGREQTRAVMNLDQAVTTVIASGVILFALQASQILATLITSAPSWIHVDIASTLDTLPKEKNAGDEASAKIFE